MDRRTLLCAINHITPSTKETYTPLTYIECTGEQYIDLGYVVQGKWRGTQSGSGNPFRRKESDEDWLFRG